MRGEERRGEAGSEKRREEESRAEEVGRVGEGGAAPAFLFVRSTTMS